MALLPIDHPRCSKSQRYSGQWIGDKREMKDNCVRIATDRLMYYLHFMDDGCKGVLWVSDALTRASKAAADLGSHTSK
ncbi:hypothetical protein L3X38_034427 [Prunus dulcis]|uniref:Uncharacterized protein n=1 Tax=Prunus dulcis TaxID=3755 RepID=A0AAD4VI27_PRUDU|nr:hypothetical protein L3X38_034427 [Prunus dulcis]